MFQSVSLLCPCAQVSIKVQLRTCGNCPPALAACFSCAANMIVKKRPPLPVPGKVEDDRSTRPRPSSVELQPGFPARVPSFEPISEEQAAELRRQRNGSPYWAPLFQESELSCCGAVAHLEEPALPQSQLSCGGALSPSVEPSLPSCQLSVWGAAFCEAVEAPLPQQFQQSVSGAASSSVVPSSEQSQMSGCGAVSHLEQAALLKPDLSPVSSDDDRTPAELPADWGTVAVPGQLTHLAQQLEMGQKRKEQSVLVSATTDCLQQASALTDGALNMGLPPGPSTLGPPQGYMPAFPVPGQRLICMPPDTPSAPSCPAPPRGYMPAFPVPGVHFVPAFPVPGVHFVQVRSTPSAPSAPRCEAVRLFGLPRCPAPKMQMAPSFSRVPSTPMPQVSTAIPLLRHSTPATPPPPTAHFLPRPRGPTLIPPVWPTLTTADLVNVRNQQRSWRAWMSRTKARPPGRN